MQGMIVETMAYFKNCWEPYSELDDFQMDYQSLLDDNYQFQVIWPMIRAYENCCSASLQYLHSHRCSAYI